ATLEQRLGLDPLALLRRYRDATRYDPKSQGVDTLQAVEYEGAVAGLAPLLARQLARLEAQSPKERAASVWEAARPLQGREFKARDRCAPVEPILSLKSRVLHIANSLELSLPQRIELFERLTETGASEATDEWLSRLLSASAIEDDRLLAQDPSTLL